MTTYRTAKPEEFLDLIDFANFVFSHDIVPFDFAKLLPKVYGSDKNTSNIHKVAVSDDGKLRAEIACLPQTVHVCGRTLRAGFIGTVSVHPRARGEGHMKALMNAWIDEVVIGLDSLVHIFNPSLLVLGGGIMNEALLIREIQSRLSRSPEPAFEALRVVRAQLGNQAALYGAYENLLVQRE